MTPMTEVKKYPTFVAHDQYSGARASAISLRKNEVKYDMHDLEEPLRTKLHGVIGWIDLTIDELRQINDVRHRVYLVGDTMMENLLKTSTLNFKK